MRRTPRPHLAHCSIKEVLHVPGGPAEQPDIGGSPPGLLTGRGPAVLCLWDMQVSKRKKQGQPCTEVSLQCSQEGIGCVPCHPPRPHEERAGLGQHSHRDSYHSTSLVVSLPGYHSHSWPSYTFHKQLASPALPLPARVITLTQTTEGIYPK